MTHWIEDAIIEGLALTDQKERLQKTAQHLLEQSKGVWTAGKLRPSLLANECPLARVKMFLGHTAQPGYSWGAVRAGKPNAGTALNFDRGFFTEALIVTALEDSGRCRLIGRSPTTVFQSGEWEAHPDLVIETDERDVELIQVKNPSYFMFVRFQNNRETALTRYHRQIATEMYVGRLMGLPIARTNLVLFSLEPSTPQVTMTHGLNLIVLSFDWQDDMAGLIESLAEDLRERVDKARRGEWPTPYPISKQFDYPCSYCTYSRVSGGGLIGCEENEKWPKEEAAVIPIGAATA